MTFKEFLEKKGISEADFKNKSAEETAQLQNEYNAEIRKESEEARKKLQEQIEKASTKEEVTALKKELNETITKMDGIIKTQGEELTKLKEKKGGAEQVKTIKEQIVEQIEANKETFEELKTNKNASFQLVIKAAGDMLTSTNTTGRVARTETDPNRVRIVRRQPFILDLVTTRTTTAKTVYYVEQVNPDGEPAMTAEGAVKAKIDWDYVERSAETKKITAFTKVSKEMLDDIDGFAQDISDEIEERIELKADTQVLTGDGTGQNLIGISLNATPFTAGALANTVPGADNTAVLRAAIAQVRRSEFQSTAIVVHPDKCAAMDLEVGSDGHYKLPPFTSADGTRIKGVPVIENTGVDADDFYVGDLRKYIFKQRQDIEISIGYDGNDWTKNMLTPLGEMRGAGYIPSNHYGAIVKGTFTVAKALLDPNVADV